MKARVFFKYFVRACSSAALRQKNCKIFGLWLPKLSFCGCGIIKIAELSFILILNFEPVKLLIKKCLFQKKVSKLKSYLVLQDPFLSNFILKEYTYTVTNTRFNLAMRYSD